jgi:hypothetical protein
MGQAKQRGTRAERIALAVVRDEALQAKKDEERAALEAQERARIAAMPPEERRRYKNRLHQQRMMTATLLGFAYGAMEPFRRVKLPKV